MPTLMRPVASAPGVTAQRVVPAAASPLTPPAIRWGDGVVLDAGPLACYLGFPAEAGGRGPIGRVLPLLRPPALQLPNGWRVATAEPWPVVTGDAVRLDGAGLTMGSWRVAPVRHWRPAVVGPAPAADPRAAVRRLAPHWPPGRPRTDHAPVTGIDLYAGAVAVVSADPSTSGGMDELTAAVAELVGLGPGSTPSGDDVLSGVALTLRLLGAGPRLDALTTAIRPRLDATSALSAHLLQAALLGYAVPQVVALLRLLGRPAQRDDNSPGFGAALADAVDQVRRIGHTSGTDLLTGIHATAATVATLDPP